MSIMSLIWGKLAEKGKIASLIGFLMAFPVNAVFVVMFFMDMSFSDDQLKTALIINAIAMTWFILPSKVRIDGKFIKVELED